MNSPIQRSVFEKGCVLGIGGGTSGKGFDLLGISESQADFCDCRVSRAEKVRMSLKVFLKGKVD